MELEKVKKELKELRKRNQLINNSVQTEEMYKARLSSLKDRGLEDSQEYKAIQKFLEKIKIIEQIKGELALEEKYFDIINDLPHQKRIIALGMFIEAKTTAQICRDVFMEKQVLYNELSKIYRIIYEKINEVEEE